eukprot:860583_1
MLLISFVFISISLCNLRPNSALTGDSGNHHTCVIHNTITKCFGRNDFGQLGIDDDVDRGDVPNDMGDNLIPTDLGSDFIPMQIEAGCDFSCALSTANKVKCFGVNTYGQIGLTMGISWIGSSPGHMGDNLLEIDLGTDFTPIQISSGYRHNCALSDTNTIKCFGSNTYGELGYGDTVIRDGSPHLGDNLPVVDLGSFIPMAITCGGHFTCALSTTNAVKCWGRNTYGTLGLGDTDHRGDGAGEMGDNLLPINLGSNFIPMQIQSGYTHTCALSTTDTVKCWGYNGDGGLGYGDRKARGDGTDMGDNLPEIDLGSGFIPMQIATGEGYTCALSTDNRVKCFGRNMYGQLGYCDANDRGDGNSEMGTNLLDIELGTGFVPSEIMVGYYQTCAISENDEVKCFGSNMYGQLGTGDLINRGDEANQMGDYLPVIDLGSFSSASVTISPTETTVNPTLGPTMNPSVGPTLNPSFHPTVAPSLYPTQAPSPLPTVPTSDPSVLPTATASDPTSSPSESTLTPTASPTVPTSIPTPSPISSEPSTSPSIYPSEHPSRSPFVTAHPIPSTPPIATRSPSGYPTILPSNDPSENPIRSAPITTGIKVEFTISITLTACDDSCVITENKVNHMLIAQLDPRVHILSTEIVDNTVIVSIVADASVVLDKDVIASPFEAEYGESEVSIQAHDSQDYNDGDTQNDHDNNGIVSRVVSALSLWQWAAIGSILLFTAVLICVLCRYYTKMKSSQKHTHMIAHGGPSTEDNSKEEVVIPTPLETTGGGLSDETNVRTNEEEEVKSGEAGEEEVDVHVTNEESEDDESMYEHVDDNSQVKTPRTPGDCGVTIGRDNGGCDHAENEAENEGSDNESMYENVDDKNGRSMPRTAGRTTGGCNN